MAVDDPKDSALHSSIDYANIEHSLNNTTPVVDGTPIVFSGITIPGGQASVTLSLALAASTSDVRLSSITLKVRKLPHHIGCLAPH